MLPAATGAQQARNRCNRGSTPPGRFWWTWRGHRRRRCAFRAVQRRDKEGADPIIEASEFYGQSKEDAVRIDSDQSCRPFSKE